MKIFVTLLCITLINFVLDAQKILTSSPKEIERKVNSTITVKCYDVDFTKNNYDFSFSNNYGSDFVVILKKEFLCKDVVKLTINSTNYFSEGSYDLTIRSIQNNKSYTLENALKVISKGDPELVSIDKKTAKKGSKLTVKFSGLRTHFKSGQASETVVSLNNYQASETLRILAKSIYVNSETDLDATFDIPSNAMSGIYFPMVENYIDNAVSIYNYKDALYIEGDEKVQILSVKQLNNASSTVKLLVTFNPDFNLKSASNTSVGVYFNNDFVNASSTVISSDQLECEINIPSNAFNGSYPLYFFYNNNEYAVFENAISINSNPYPTIINFPIKVYAGKSNPITLQGLNINFAQASSSLYFHFDQGSNTLVVDVDKSKDESKLSFDVYVPKNTPAGFYSTSLYRNDFVMKEFIGEFKNSVEVINQNTPSFLIKDNGVFIANNSTSFQVLKRGDIDVLKDIKEIYVYFETGVKTPVYITNINNETLTLSCFISPLVNSGNYSINFETFKDGIFISQNHFRVKGKNPGIYEVKPAIVAPGSFYDFTIKMDNVVLNNENLKGLLFEFQNQCNTVNTIQSYNSDSMVVRVFVENDVKDGDYKILLTNTNYQLVSEEILKVRRIAHLEETTLNSAFKVYPNPSNSGNFNISIDGELYTGEYQICDLQGKLVYQHIFENESKLSILNPGIYIVSVHTNNRTYNEKISVE